MNPDQLISTFGIRCLFHFTDRRNLASIRELGLLSWKEIQSRDGFHVVAGGNDWSHCADAMAGVDGHVHLCLIDDHPMEFRAREDGRIQESVYLRISPAVLKLPGVLWTADVANKSGVHALPLESAADILDFEVVYRRTDWRDPIVRERRNAAKKYEVLVPERISSDLITFPP